VDREVDVAVQVVGPVGPDEEEVEAAARALERVQAYLARDPDGQERLDLAGPEGSVVVPRVAVELLARVLAHLASGQSVSIVPVDVELTTQQAADLLNVSRPYLIGLLEAGEIQYRKVGTKRRVHAGSLVEYKRRDDLHRREAADELSVLTQEMGLS
jgi:excisionase family DNA binding protein